MSGVLETELVYLYPNENAKIHHTDNYELIYMDPPVPVLRRGTEFTAIIRFSNRPLVLDKDVVRLIFTFGPKPNPTRGTKAVLRITSKDVPQNPKLWTVRVVRQRDTEVTVEIKTAVDCPVGNWNLRVETSSRTPGLPVNTFAHETDIYFLFNPWNKDDVVYMPEERLLDEYVLTDVGKIWIGPLGSSRGREWVFGQFDSAVLLGTTFMLDRSKLPWTRRGDPVILTRIISKMVNSNDDNGVLVGRWDGEYEDGTAPSAWTGSIEILEQYLETKEPVKYGQCWVFSGVVTAICRALGIPSRVVSNLVSAHDANSTLSIDRYYNTNNESLGYDPLNEFGEDSIWNYHVWNDVWMARCDLPKGYGGWQAIDATPQETSDGYYQCGPASLEAIRRGYVAYNYDVAFMVASVNADIMNWKEDLKSDFGYSKIYCNKYHVGRMILTKLPWIYDPNGDKDREDITEQYKPKEGTPAERLALLNAVRGTELAKSFYALPDAKVADMEFTLVDLERVPIGDPFLLSVEIKNNSDKERVVKASLSASSIFYTGVQAKLVKKATGEFKIKAKSADNLRMTIAPEEYLDKLVEYGIMKIYAIVTVVDTNQTWADEDDFQVLKPNITIKISGDVTVGKPTDIILTFKNPLKMTLTNCKFGIGGSGLMKNHKFAHGNIGPLANIVAKWTVTPKTSGEQKIVATFTSKELVDITGSVKVDALDNEE